MSRILPIAIALALVAPALAVSAPGYAYDAAAPQNEPAAEGESEAGPTEPAPAPEAAMEPPVQGSSLVVEVAVTTIGADGADEPLADQEVTLHVVTPPHQLESSRVGTTGADGIARFDVSVRAGAEAYAEIDNGRRAFSAPVSVSAPGRQRLSLTTMRTVRDPSVLFAASMQTILEPWEEYVVFSQVWTFGVDEMVRFSSSTEDMGSIVRIPLPEGAEGVTIVHPADQARAMDGYVALGTDVAPAGLDDGPQRPHLIVRFSLPTEGHRSLSYEQTLPMDVSRASIVVPQVSSHAKHRELDVRIDVPLCDDGGASDVMCFREISDQAEGTLLRADMDVLVARGEGRADQVMRVRTTGWPAPYPWGRQLAVVLSLLALVGGGALYRAELARRRTTRGATEAALAALRLQEQQLLGAAGDLERQFADGELLQRDYDRIRGRLLEQLGVVYRRLRELEPPPTEPSDHGAA